MDEPGRPAKITFNKKSPWRAVAGLHEANGRSRAEARDLVILEWLSQGKTEPLLEAIDAGEVVGLPVLRWIAFMLRGDEELPYHLILKRRPGPLGARKQPGILWRDWFMALEFEKRCKEVASKKAFEETAEAFGIDETTVRRAVTWYRTIRKKTQAVDPHTLKKS